MHFSVKPSPHLRAGTSPLHSATMSDESSPAFEAAFAKVAQLCADFDAGKGHYLSPKYQESEVRKDFIDKFFTALGWDVNHDIQKNPYEQEVKPENPVSAGGSRRADYAFYVAPNHKDVRFFVEAKKPFGDIATKDNYFQTNRYGWSKNTPLAALTDFEQFHVIDCRYKPHIDASLNRGIAKFHYTDYTKRDKFAQIYWLFSREAVADGSLEKRAKELPKPRGKAVQRGLFPGGYQTVDEAFLEQLDLWREALAKGFKKHNHDLDSETLTEITQRVLDRIVFMRFLEDKGIEPDRIVAQFGDKASAWDDFIAASRRLDGIYNGIVFKPHPLFDKKGFAVDDDAFADVCEEISHVNSPYDFNAIPVHILGSIYERFLGRVIVATPQRVRVEDKPEVRKAGGVYYTPEYIVTYIVENTVGKLIAGKSPAQISEMRFADIACGSGSFLIGVYDLLLAYHARWYNDHPDRAEKDGCIKKDDGSWHLSLAQRRAILVNNIYGVDIDHQSCEVAQLSLYLKLLEDETTGSARAHQLEFKETLLPTLNKNIVCGNSLIGRDILNEQLFASDEERKLNPMDFEDAFPHVFRPKPGKMIARETVGDVFALDASQPAPATDAKYTMAKKDTAPPKIQSVGFDAIIGNPPWGALLSQAEKVYFRNNYDSIHVRTPESFNYFVYRMWSKTKSEGFAGTIIPSSFLNQHEFWKTRKLLVESAKLGRVCNLGDGVFRYVTAPTCIVIFSKGATGDLKLFMDLRTVSRDDLPNALSTGVNALDATNIGSNTSEYALQVRNDNGILCKCNRWPSLKEVAEDVATGVSSGLDKAFIYTEDQASELQLERQILKKLVIGEEIHRFLITPHSQKMIVYSTREVELEDYPNVFGQVLQHKEKLSKRVETASGIIPWYTLYRPRRQKLFDEPKILIRQTSDIIRAAYDACGYYCLKSGIIVQLKDESRISYACLVAVLNSRLIQFIYDDLVGEQARVFPEVKPVQLFKLPIVVFDFKNSGEKARHDRMVHLVEQMMASKKQLSAATTEKDKTYYENKCAALDGQIDRLVYELYGLTDEEIEIVEAATKK